MAINPGPIAMAANLPVYAKSGTVPDMSGAIGDYYQPMIFQRVAKIVEGFQVVETGTQYSFQGTIQPLTQRQLMLLPEGERAWTWFMLHADPSLTLQVDEVVIYKGKQTRVMGRKDFFLYGYVEYGLVQDWTGSGPTVAP